MNYSVVPQPRAIKMIECFVVSERRKRLEFYLGPPIFCMFKEYIVFSRSTRISEQNN